MTTDARLLTLKTWLNTHLTPHDYQLLPVKGDASFRRYFRIKTHSQSLIAMDAPPQKEDCRPFVAVAQGFAHIGLVVPKIIAQDLHQGFLLLTDLGSKLYLDILDQSNVNALYQVAFAALLKLQQNNPFSDGVNLGWTLPRFDEKLYRLEFHLFKVWFLEHLLAMKLSAREQQWLNDLCDTLIASALAQPQVCVHRDYHSRNLLQLPNSQIGIIDFQDAVLGPVTYDLLSLLRDCYIDWPSAQVDRWVKQYYQQALRKGIKVQQQQQTFIESFNLIGIQRHLKVLGIFARLALAYHKPDYLKDIPRVLDYLQQEAAFYPTPHALKAFIQRLSEQFSERMST